MADRYKIGDRLYCVHAFAAEDHGDGLEPAEVGLSIYVIRTIRRRPRRILFNSPPSVTPTVTAYPSEWVRETKAGLVFDKHCPRWALKQWSVDARPEGLSRSKSGAYRKALADLRRAQRRGGYREPLAESEFRLLEGRLKAGVTRFKK